MSFGDLGSFLRELDRMGELVEVDVPVDPRLEAAEIHRRVAAADGPALLFTRPAGSDFPLATNMFGTRRRAEAAFGQRPEHLVRRAVETIQHSMPPTLGQAWASRDLLWAALRVGSRTVRRAPVTEVLVHDVDLGRLPVLTSWPEDGGPFVTLPLVYTEPPGGGAPNLGIYRLQVHGPATTGMHWQIAKGGGFHFATAESRGEDLPVTVFLGGPPALILAAVAPLPENVPEMLLASLLLGKRVRTCGGPGPHPLVADAEFALTGHVPAGVRKPEGPFGDHYGYYSLRHDYPVLRVESMSRRRDAIYPATVVGKPRQEDYYIGEMLQELLAPLFPLVMPGVVDLWSYGETGFHALAAAIVRERYHREAMVSAFRILGEGQLALTKFLLVTDRPTPLRDIRATLEHVLERTRPETDLYVLANLSMDTLDYTGPEVNRGSKGVWLGLGEPVRELPRELASIELPAGCDVALPFCGGCLVVGGPPYPREPRAADRVARHPAFADWPLVVLTDQPRRAVSSPTSFLWTTFTRFEPAADISAAETTVVRNHISYRGPVVIDARLKPSYPPELHVDPDTAELVDRRWAEYFPGGRVEMGDADTGHLDR